MHVVALAGGGGGAKMVEGLAKILSPEELTIIVNTGDDFTQFGLYISPDLDTVCYTLANISNPKTGWGLKKETWNAMKWIESLGGPIWFSLGDKDLGTHLERTRRLSRGESLTSITQHFCQSWGIAFKVYPMCDEQVATMVKTKEFGWLAFQEYFVRNKCSPSVLEFKYVGVKESHINSKLSKDIQDADLIVFCPSNPWVSIDPILKIHGLQKLILGKNVIAVSPIIGNKTFKGPAAKIFQEMGLVPSALSVAEHYKGIIKSLVIDEKDRELIPAISRCGIICHTTNISMKFPKDRIRLAKFIMESVRIYRE